MLPRRRTASPAPTGGCASDSLAAVAWGWRTCVMACEAGKDVYVEKPLALSIREGRLMVDVARRHNRVVQMGTQQRSASHYADAIAYVKSGRLGKIRVVKAWAYQDWMGNIPPAP